MGSFVENLWSSIFTPGPTPTLLVATNVTFAALQSLLLALLIATYSIHFFVLSFLSAALWWSINWFARELRQVQAQEAHKKEKDGDHQQNKSRSNSNAKKTPGTLDTDSDTETEQTKEGTPMASASTAAAACNTAALTSLQPPEEQEGSSRKRLSVSGESSENGSTDSEWEKVDDSHTS